LLSGPLSLCTRLGVTTRRNLDDTPDDDRRKNFLTVVSRFSPHRPDER
jgi:hypothetical protein